MISNLRALFPLTRRRTVLGSLYFSLVLLLPALLVSPTSYFHPLWVLAFYFNGFGVIRTFTEDFASTKNPALVYHGVFGSLQFLTGVAIAVSSYVIGRENQSQLWSMVAIGLWVLGAWNIKEASHRWNEAVYKRAQEKRIKDQQAAAAAQTALEALESLELAEESQRNEEALAADLAGFLTGSDQAGQGRSEV